MPPVDYDALAKKYGGQLAPPPAPDSGPNLDALAAKYGGTSDSSSDSPSPQGPPPPPPAPGDAQGVKNWLDNRYPKQPPPPVPNSPMDAAVGFVKGSVVNTAKGLWDAGKRVLLPPQDTRGKIASIAGPLGPLASDIVASHIDTGKKAVQAAKDKDYLGAAGYGAAALIPGVGPGAAATGEKLGEGLASGDWQKTGEALGEAAVAIPSAVSLARQARVPGTAPSRPGWKPRVTPKLDVKLNPKEAASVAFGESRGVPIDAATATGNEAAAALQHHADYSIAGGSKARASRVAQSEALSRVADELADEAHPTPIVPEQAGGAANIALENEAARLRTADDATQSQLASRIHPDPLTPEQAGASLRRGHENQILSLDAEERAAYNQAFEQAERNPRNFRQVPIGVDEKGATITEPMPLPVFMGPIKDALKPIYARMKMFMEPAKRYSSKGYTAIESIVAGPDYMPASIAEEGLSGLKSLARETRDASVDANPGLRPAVRGVNEGVAAHAVGLLQDAIDNTVRSIAGQDTLDNLQLGRAKHAEKSSIVEALNDIREEPVQAFGQATYSRDAGIKQLDRMADIAPEEMPKIGRAYFDDLWDLAKNGKYEAARNSWRNLGPLTKQILFGHDPTLVGDIDDFMQSAGQESTHFAKMATEEPVRAYNSYLFPKDASIERLRKLASLDPEAPRKIGRAWMSDIITRAGAEGGFGGADGIWRSWKNLGPETRNIVFGPQLASDLDKFFLLAKRIGKRPNPSGSAVVGQSAASLYYAFAHPITGVPLLLAGKPLADLLFTPEGVRALTNGLTVPVGKTLARPPAAAQILKLAGDSAIPLEQFQRQQGGQDNQAAPAGPPPPPPNGAGQTVSRAALIEHAKQQGANPGDVIKAAQQRGVRLID